MEQNFKKASRLKLRFQTSKGVLSVEQLWDLSLNELDGLAVHLEESCKNKTKSFLNKKTEQDELSQLRFDIVMDVLTIKVEEREALQKANENKLHDQKILQLIQAKKEEQLSNLTVEELEKLLLNK